MGLTVERAPGAHPLAPLATLARASFKAQISLQAAGPVTLVSMRHKVSTLACLASLDMCVLELQDRLEVEGDWRLPVRLVVPSWMAVQATLALRATIAHLELDQKRLAQLVLISQNKPSTQLPPALPAQPALTAMTSVSQNAALARDLQTPSQAPQAANA